MKIDQKMRIESSMGRKSQMSGCNLLLLKRQRSHMSFSLGGDEARVDGEK